MYSSPYILTTIVSKRMRGGKHAAFMGEVRNGSNTFVEKA
jgi:hypothetical protein